MIKNLCRKRNYENKKNYLDTKKFFFFILLKVKRDQTFHYHFVCDTMPSYVSYKYARMFRERRKEKGQENIH